MTDIKKLALRISKQKNSCKKCVYSHGEWCRLPYNETCADGVYKWLMEREIENYNSKQQKGGLE